MSGTLIEATVDRVYVDPTIRGDTGLNPARAGIIQPA